MDENMSLEGFLSPTRKKPETNAVSREVVTSIGEVALPVLEIMSGS